MPRHLFIVSRREPELCGALRQRFAREPRVEVILDRRLGERRRQASKVRIERRSKDRRTRPEIDAELLERSHAMVTLP